ncbi:unnamed protein product [Arabidopsis lyrata]|nr:unnamed protein product [Arabidopsis lyrata]
MRTTWLQKNFTPPLAFKIDEPICSQSNNNNEEEDDVDWENQTEPISPKFFNAFEFISSMSSGFDLSSLFESKRKVKSVFTSKSLATEVMERIETVTKEMNMKVKRTKDFKVKMEGKTEGRKGRLSMTAEVFEVAPEILWSTIVIPIVSVVQPTVQWSISISIYVSVQWSIYVSVQ